MGKKERAIVDSVNKELCEMRDDRVMVKHPTRLIDAKASELPPPVKELFMEFVADFIRTTRQIREGDGESFRSDQVFIRGTKSIDDLNVEEELFEVEFQSGEFEGRRIWKMGIHDAFSPVNPSGHDFWCWDDGAFVGWNES